MFATFKQSDGLVCEAQNEELTAWRAVGHLGGTGSISAAEEGVAGECPNVFALQGRSVLIRSTYPISYLLGDFDPGCGDVRRGRPVARPRPWLRRRRATGTLHARPLRHLGLRRPAGDPASDPYRGSQRTVLAGWVSGFAEGRGWRGCMSLPRVLSLKGGSLIQTPLPELSRLRRRHTRVERLALEDGVRVIPEARGKALEIVAELAPRDAARCGLRVRCRNDGSGGLAISYAAGPTAGPWE